MPAIVTYNNSTIATVTDSATLKTKGTWSPYDIVVRDVAEDSYAIAFINRTISSIPSNVSATVTSIGNYAFYSCRKLSSLYLMGSSVVSLGGTNVFTYTPMSVSTYLGYFGSIYVPASLLTAYQAARYWSVYSSRFVGV